jgi:hypothetical protein
VSHGGSNPECTSTETLRTNDAKSRTSHPPNLHLLLVGGATLPVARVGRTACTSPPGAPFSVPAEEQRKGGTEEGATRLRCASRDVWYFQPAPNYLRIGRAPASCGRGTLPVGQCRHRDSHGTTRLGVPDPSRRTPKSRLSSQTQKVTSLPTILNTLAFPLGIPADAQNYQQRRAMCS